MKKLFLIIVTILLSLATHAQTKYLVNKDFTKVEKKTSEIKKEFIFDDKLSSELNLKTIKAQGKEVQDTIMASQKFDGFYQNKIEKIYFTKLEQMNNTVVQAKKPKTLTTSRFAWEIIYLLFLTVVSSLFYLINPYNHNGEVDNTLAIIKSILMVIGVIGLGISWILSNQIFKDFFILMSLISFMSMALSVLVMDIMVMDGSEYIFMSIIHAVIGSIIIYFYPNLWAWALNGFVFLFMWLLFKIPFAWDYMHGRTPGQIIKKAQNELDKID